MDSKKLPFSKPMWRRLGSILASLCFFWASFGPLQAEEDEFADIELSRAPEEPPRMPIPAEVLKAVEVIEKDPVSDEAFEAMDVIMRFCNESEDVLLVIGKETLPWIDEQGGNEDEKLVGMAKQLLLVSYCAGSAKAQLTDGIIKDNPGAGWTTVIRTYDFLRSRTNISFLSINRLAEFQNLGWLNEYAAIITDDLERMRDGTPDDEAGSELTRDSLEPSNGLLHDGKYEEACALYIPWLAQNPYDANTNFDLGYARYLQATAQADDAQAKEYLKLARPNLLKAAVYGCTNPLLESLLVSTAPERKNFERTFSESRKAHEFIDLGEKAFAQRRFNDAVTFYNQALQYDPKSYVATLYLGDCYYAQKDYAGAIDWFQKAVALDPNRETAFRYMADAYSHTENFDGAITAYVNALIAEPNNKLPRAVFERVASSRNRLYKATSPIARLPIPIVIVKPDGGIEVGINPVDESPYVLPYVMGRVGWITKEGARHFASSQKQHHCAAEEMAGLRAFAEHILAENDKGDTEASDWLPVAAEITKLDQAGLLEAFVYIDRSTNGIAQGYPEYRATHRELLVRYLREFRLGEINRR